MRPRVRKRLEDTTLLALQMEEGVVSQQYRWLLEAAKGKRTDSPLELPEGMQPR